MRSRAVLAAVIIALAIWLAPEASAFHGSASGELFTSLYQPTPTPVASSQDGDLVGDTAGRGGNFDKLITRSVVRFTSGWSNPNVDPGRAHPEHPAAAEGAGVVWPGPNEARCAQKRLGRFSPITKISGQATCVAVWVCGGERIDDVVSGDVAGAAALGRYAQFLTGVIGQLGSIGGAGNDAGLAQVNSVSELLVDRGLAGDHSDSQIPVFYWCGRRAQGFSDVVIELQGPDPTRWPSFGWATTIEDEYNISGLRNDALLALEALIGLNKPEVGAVPPIDKGFTWVQWPTWFWVDTATEPLAVFDENDAATVRLDMRAVVDRVEWAFAGEPLRACTLDQMLAYDKGAHDAVVDAPECTHRFTEAVRGGDLEATVFYSVEERIRDRIEDKNGAYPDSPWVPHPDDPELQLSTTIPDYGVHEILSVNTPINMTDEEIAELLRNE